MDFLYWSVAVVLHLQYEFGEQKVVWGFISGEYGEWLKTVTHFWSKNAWFLLHYAKKHCRAREKNFDLATNLLYDRLQYTDLFQKHPTTQMKVFFQYSSYMSNAFVHLGCGRAATSRLIFHLHSSPFKLTVPTIRCCMTDNWVWISIL